MTRLRLILAAAGMLAASPVWADDGRVPRVEIGGNLSIAIPLIFDDSVGVLAGAGPRFTLNVSRRVAVELIGETLGPTEDTGTFALYVTQVKIPLRISASGARSLSLTVGAAGGASYQHFQERRVPRLDGSTVVHPEYRRVRVAAPTNFSAGVSGDHVISRYVAGTWGVQAFIGSLGAASLVSFGVSFGIGGYR